MKTGPGRRGRGPRQVSESQAEAREPSVAPSGVFRGAGRSGGSGGRRGREARAAAPGVEGGAGRRSAGRRGDDHDRRRRRLLRGLVPGARRRAVRRLGRARAQVPGREVVDSGRGGGGRRWRQLRRQGRRGQRVFVSFLVGPARGAVAGGASRVFRQRRCARSSCCCSCLCSGADDT